MYKSAYNITNAKLFIHYFKYTTFMIFNIIWKFTKIGATVWKAFAINLGFRTQHR